MTTEDDWKARYVSLAQRLEALDRENRSLRARLIIADGREIAGENIKLVQSEIVQREIARMNEQLQHERQEITRLRGLLGERANAD